MKDKELISKEFLLSPSSSALLALSVSSSFFLCLSLSLFLSSSVSFFYICLSDCVYCVCELSVLGVAELKRLCKANNAVCKTISSIKSKMKAMSAQFKHYQNQIEPLSHELDRTKNEMVSEQRCHIANLTKYIFPIETVQQKGSVGCTLHT